VLRRAAPPGPELLSEAQAIPTGFLVGLAEGLLDRHAELLRRGQPPTAARVLAVTEAVQTFHADADQRSWTVEPQRITRLARAGRRLRCFWPCPPRKRRGHSFVRARLEVTTTGNVAHTHPTLVVRAIAAATLLLAVLAMLETLTGDAQEVTRLRPASAASGTPPPTA
jgi:hypothetical protein